MTRLIVTAAAIAIGFAVTSNDIKAGSLDRIEDRIDRLETTIDRQTNHGRLDVLEDRIDAAESISDRRGIEGPRWIDRRERRAWWRLWGASES